MIRAAVIGLGRIGWGFEEEKLRAKPCSHLGCWKTIEDVEVAGIADSNDETLHRVTKASGMEGKSYTNYKEMISDKRLDIVSVATPPETHERIVFDIINIRKPKLIFLEKPIANTLEEAERIVAFCEANKVKLAVDHSRRWDFFWQHFAEVINLNKPRVNSAKALITGGIMNVGIHAADLFGWFGIEDERCSLVIENNVDYLLFEIDVFFRQGRLRAIDNGTRATIYVSEASERYDGINELAEEGGFSRTGDLKTPMLRACEQLKRCVEVESEQPLCQGSDGLLALERCLSWVKKD